MKKIMSITSTFGLISLILVLSGCSSDKEFRDRMEKTLNENPELVMKVIENHPEQFVATLQNAVKDSQQNVAKQREMEEKKKLQKAFDNPLVPKITKNDIIIGPEDAPLTLVEYSDFECPFCKKGFETVQDLRKKYEGKIRFVFKHLPLSFHKQAMISAQYYEAIRLQSKEKATKFHDLVFNNQRGLAGGKQFLDKMSKEAGANLSKIKKDIDSEIVKTKIEDDMAEAATFGMQGTPGFLLNGIPVKGAYPVAHFEEIIRELKKRGKVSL